MGKEPPKVIQNAAAAKAAAKAKEAEIARRYGLMAQATTVQQLAKIKRAMTEGGLYSGMAYELAKPHHQKLMPSVNAEIARQKKVEEAARDRFSRAFQESRKGSTAVPTSSSSSSSSAVAPPSSSSAAVLASRGYQPVVMARTLPPNSGGTRRKRRQNLTRRRRHRRR